MMRKRGIILFPWLCLCLMLLVMVSGENSAQAFTLGKAYDKTNWEEIRDMVPPSVLEWVKKGAWILQTKKPNFADELSLDPKYLELSKSNEGKYDINPEGLLVSKKTGDPEFLVGNPFPTIDPGDPKIAEKVMENYKFTLHFRMEGSQSSGMIRWIGTNGLEREIEAPEYLLYYLNRIKGGPFPNPSKFLEQTIHYVAAPMDLRGTVQMSWIYIDDREGTGFAYVPMLRRVRRVSVAARSDPFAGSDMTVDDSRGWGGKERFCENETYKRGDISRTVCIF